MSRVDRIVGILNGVAGDVLERRGMALATPMQLIAHPSSVASGSETPSRIVISIHGLMSTERTWFMDDGSTYGSQLAQDLGYLPLYIRYNTGRHISENGEALHRILDEFVRTYPGSIDEIALIGHSMGGLVLRSACHVAAEADDGNWLPLLKRAFYLGSPHLGAPLERFGNLTSWILKTMPWGNPYTNIVAKIINLRSSGIKDLRYANLSHADWEGHDADELLRNRRHPVPLLPHIRHHLIAGSVSNDPRLRLLFGDAIVPVRSATGQARFADRSALFPQQHVRIIEGISHSRLSGNADVYQQIRAWCEEPLSGHPGGQIGDKENQ